MDFEELNATFLVAGQYVLYSIYQNLYYITYTVCAHLCILLTEDSPHSRTLTLRFLLNVVWMNYLIFNLFLIL